MTLNFPRKITLLAYGLTMATLCILVVPRRIPVERKPWDLYFPAGYAPIWDMTRVPVSILAYEESFKAWEQKQAAQKKYMDIARSTIPGAETMGDAGLLRILRDLKQFRKYYPEYNDLSDDILLARIKERFSDLPPQPKEPPGYVEPYRFITACVDYPRLSIELLGATALMVGAFFFFAPRPLR